MDMLEYRFAVRMHEERVQNWRRERSLGTRLERGRVTFGTRVRHALMQAFAYLMPGGTRTEAANKLATSLSRDK